MTDNLQAIIVEKKKLNEKNAVLRNICETCTNHLLNLQKDESV